MNFLKETIHALQGSGKAPSDVEWVGTNLAKATWAQFTEVADFEYDEGFGGNEIDLSFMVVGKDFWLERHEYDGSEWWEFKEQPKKPALDILDNGDLLKTIME